MRELHYRWTFCSFEFLTLSDFACIGSLNPKQTCEHNFFFFFVVQKGKCNNRFAHFNRRDLNLQKVYAAYPYRICTNDIVSMANVCVKFHMFWNRHIHLPLHIQCCQASLRSNAHICVCSSFFPLILTNASLWKPHVCYIFFFVAHNKSIENLNIKLICFFSHSVVSIWTLDIVQAKQILQYFIVFFGFVKLKYMYKDVLFGVISFYFNAFECTNRSLSVLNVYFNYITAFCCSFGEQKIEIKIWQK